MRGEREEERTRERGRWWKVMSLKEGGVELEAVGLRELGRELKEMLGREEGVSSSSKKLLALKLLYDEVEEVPSHRLDPSLLLLLLPTRTKSTVSLLLLLPDSLSH